MEISNRHGDLRATDNGRAIDLAALTDAWRAAHLEQGAPIDSTTGIGILAMVPRSVKVSSHGWTARLYRDFEGNVLWDVEREPDSDPKTVLQCWEETWNLDAVQAAAAFGRMRVTGDGIPCMRLPFVSERATRYAALGCRIEIRPSEELTRWHTPHQGDDRWRTLINCGGRLLGFNHFPLARDTLRALVEFEGWDTMIPSESLLEDDPRLRARDRLRPEQIWYQLSARFHLPYEEHQHEFTQQLNAFWKTALESARRHPHETCRSGEDVQKDAWR